MTSSRAPLHERRLLGRDDQVVDADRQARPCRVGEAELLEAVEHLDGLLETVAEIARLHELLQPLLLQQAVDERHALRNRVVQDDAADGGVDDLVVDRLHFGVDDRLVVARRRHVLQLARVAQPDRRQRFELARFERDDDVVGVAERATLALGAGLRLGQVVAARARCPATAPRSARRWTATGCCSTRASAPRLRSAPRATAECAPPSGRRRSPR